MQFNVLLCLADPCQFIESMSGAHNASFIVWADLSKCGRLSMAELNQAVETIGLVLQKKPLCSVAVVVCPILPSERVKNGIRGEVRYLK